MSSKAQTCLSYSVKKKKNSIIMYRLILTYTFCLLRMNIKEISALIKIFFHLKSSSLYNYDLEISKCFSYLKMIVHLFIKIY